MIPVKISRFRQELADFVGTSNTTSEGHEMNTGTFAAKKFLWVEGYMKHSGNVHSLMRVNTDTSNNFGTGRSNDFATNANDNGQAYTKIQTAENAKHGFFRTFILNISNREKIFISHVVQGDTGTSSTPNSGERAGYWTNTSDQITSIQMIEQGSPGALTSGTLIRVMGNN